MLLTILFLSSNTFSSVLLFTLWPDSARNYGIIKDATLFTLAAIFVLAWNASVVNYLESFIIAMGASVIVLFNVNYVILTLNGITELFHNWLRVSLCLGFNWKIYLDFGALISR